MTGKTRQSLTWSGVGRTVSCHLRRHAKTSPSSEPASSGFVRRFVSPELRSYFLALLRRYHGEDVDIAASPNIIALATSSLADIPPLEARSLVEKLKRPKA